ncbi:phosphoglycolate phosphatase [Streptomyces longisporoflavus]|uniref:HAD family hydrolase n=1 Tax=Streptomyces longisporoflavus TaxID=28044 RepID=UPI0019C77AE7|nr:HAD family phosphatase [Streptomyces longisporoflavus]GGV56271.1 phosphoglycolate phosphatase [Streptomyces longisporoflavus]
MEKEVDEKTALDAVSEAAKAGVEAAPPRAVLTDFGGVLTTSVFDSFRSYSARVSEDPLLIERLFREDAESSALLVEHECGRLSEADFERGIAARLREKGVEVEPAGLVAAIGAGMRPDEKMIAALVGLRARGVPVAIVSNALGDDCYRGYDMEALADVVVISSEIGSRKPGRRIYRTACDRLGVEPPACVMIDDLEHNLSGAARLGIRGLHHVDSTETARALGELFGVDSLTEA